MLLDQLKEYKIVLATRSPRRHELMKGLRIPFEVRIPEAHPEEFPGHLDRYGIPEYLAKQKATGIVADVPQGALFITADTIVWINGRVLPKPPDREEARCMLNELSGNRHEVITGVAIRSSDRLHTFHSSTCVFFRELTGSEIDFYIDHFEPFDKAGAYGIQEWIGYAGIKRIEGSYFNVVGLPVQELYVELERFINA